MFVLREVEIVQSSFDHLIDKLSCVLVMTNGMVLINKKLPLHLQIQVQCKTTNREASCLDKPNMHLVLQNVLGIHIAGGELVLSLIVYHVFSPLNSLRT